MGTWGTGIFDNDLSSDIRTEFRELIGEGLSALDATNKLFVNYEDSINDPDDGPIFWIALAATQTRCGRLIDLVKERALQIIESGDGLKDGRDSSDPKEFNRRRVALEKLKAELNDVQRQPSKIRKAFHDRTAWKVGYAIAYRLLSGRSAILRVIGLTENGKSLTPIVELCDWTGNEIPSADVILRLPTRQTKRFNQLRSENKLHPWDIRTDHKFTVYSLGKRDFPVDRVIIVAMDLPIKPQDVVGATYFGGWKQLDWFLQSQFGVC